MAREVGATAVVRRVWQPDTQSSLKLWWRHSTVAENAQKMAKIQKKNPDVKVENIAEIRFYNVVIIS